MFFFFFFFFFFLIFQMGRIDTLTGEAALTKRFSLPSENGSTIKGFIEDSISSEDYFARRHLVKFDYAV